LKITPKAGCVVCDTSGIPWPSCCHSLFRQAGVTIAFPQRDVHLNANGPLDIRVVSEPSGSEASKRFSVVQKQTED